MRIIIDFEVSKFTSKALKWPLERYCVKGLCIEKMHPSLKAYNPRAFETFWKPFIRVFQALAVSNHSIFYSTQKFSRLLYFVGISTLQISLLTYILAYLDSVHFIGNKHFKESPLMNYVSFLSIAGNYMAHLVSHLEPLFTRKYEEDIYRRLNEINEIFALKLNYVTDFNVIRKNFIRKTVSFFIFASSLSFGYSLYYIPGDPKGMVIFILCRVMSVVMIRSRRCQIAFHVNNLTNILKDLQILLKRQQESYHSNTNEAIVNSREKIRYLRDIYSNAWLVKNLLSCCFGWSFITFLLEFSFELINSAYWAYINIKLYKSTGKIIRKFHWVK